MTTTETATPATPSNFIRSIIAEDSKTSKFGGQVVTRFPPEPNGYLHIGHAKSICLNFGLALENNGQCHLRFDDTNPTKEDVEYVDAIENDVRWLGFDWGTHLYFAADYFERFYDYAVQLINLGKAYVDDLTAEQIREYRGTLTEAGKDSPFRDRSVADNCDLFARMRAGEFPDGSKVLRAKIDMASPNINLRDPALYRIRRDHHHRTGDAWCIYPMYSYAHPLEDMIEGVTHSICTLEFEDQRPFYDWVLDTLQTPCHPQQIEFARLNLSFTMMSKRNLLTLVKDGHVAGWDDPRMPTIAGLRRRGYTPESIRAFCEVIGVSKAASMVDVAVLEHCIRDDLNPRAARVMAVLKPIKVIIDNYPEGQVEEIEAPFFPDEPARMGTKQVLFSKELYIERDDFMEDPPKKFFRLSPGKEVRLRWAYVIKCESVVKDASGEIVELHCTYDPDTKGGNPVDGRQVKGILHWVPVAQAKPIEVRLYDRLFTVENPAKAEDFRTVLNPDSLTVLQGFIEPSVADAAPGTFYQFERTGYFYSDPIDTKDGKLVFNRIVPLRDAWAKLVKSGQQN
ncbi:MAG: glutamine--tRNA ligase/YqeY domain fusion protein [Candidatus Sericytochromatia bacterium]|nr:glutamine--tRNA ligase/YqeY domain fusion protein [Candidatus Sericytochromatia bacterium]